MSGSAIKQRFGSPSFGQIIGAKAFDLFCVLFLSLLLSFATIGIFQNTPNYLANASNKNEICLNSHLYVEKANELVLLSDSLEEKKELSFNEKSETIDEALTHFYAVFIDKDLSGKGAETYLGYKTSAKYDDKSLFNESGARELQEKDYDVIYYTFYRGVLVGKAVLQLQKTEAYFNASKGMVLWTILALSIAVLASSFSLLLFIPFFAKNRTLGMMVAKLVFKDETGDAINRRRYLVRFLFQYFVVILFSLATGLVFAIVDLAVCASRGDKRGLSDLVCHIYPVSESRVLPN